MLGAEQDREERDMTSYTEMRASELREELGSLKARYDAIVEKGLSLDMSRGKPAPAQLDLSTPMLTILSDGADCFSEDGIDCRNYGTLEGIVEARRLMACMLDDDPDTTIVLGSSSLTAMYDTIARGLDYGFLGERPWSDYDRISFICVVPGYDRHFTILDSFGIDMVCVPMLPTGPDMAMVESIVADDETVKGIWCVPKYSNPTGVTYSDETVRRLASMECAAPDFRILWDNAYCVHDLYPRPSDQDHLLDIRKACEEAGTRDRYLKFASTSKVTFAGGGICAMAASEANVAEAKARLSSQMIGGDKLSQLRHARFLPDEDALRSHMSALADVIRPKFELVEDRLADSLGDLGIARWTDPKGGYFVSFDGLDGTARRTVSLAKDAGVVLTSAGATYPHGDDPHDSNIRIAPTMPSLDELSEALDVFTCCVRIAAIEALLDR